MNIYLFDNRSHKALRNGRMAFATPPFPKLNLKPNDVYLFRSIGLGKYLKLLP